MAVERYHDGLHLNLDPIMTADTDTRSRIEALLAAHPVVLFMKGSPEAPMCGFSAATSAALGDLLPAYHSVNVLADEDIREGIKTYGQWPTIPQLYIKGELIGGADIVRSMVDSGELQAMLGLPAPDRTAPDITITDAAAKAISGNLPDPAEAVLHLRIDARRQAEFSLAPADDNPIVTEANGIPVHFDVGSAQRAHGIVIDWVESVGGAGLSLSFPGAGGVKPISVRELNQRLDRGDITVVDVRTGVDRGKAPMPTATVLEEAGEAAIGALPKDTALAFLCHHGHSSRTVAEQFAAHGFTEVYNVEGGIDAWSREVDDSVPRY